ncbi:hypothetical protein NONO_c60130 [Nocardia nova SH22a]|uniref:Uncharacterized protein n=1 Tax=Nocardia nova SH22a TaxID=1415166 RepID=W5TNP7_9NOCA|nr:hypothetical protein [Nocardia nova]AHH20789.1 hypothetical protein NONO_c60130 [Nocardia nova SH22a]
MPDQTPEPPIDIEDLTPAGPMSGSPNYEDNWRLQWMREQEEARARQTADPVSLPSDAALADLRARLIEDGVIPPSDDPAPEITPAARRFAEDMTTANRMPFAELVVRYARALSALRTVQASRYQWMGIAQHLQSYGRNMQQVAATNADAHDRLRDRVAAEERRTGEAARLLAAESAQVATLKADRNVITGQLRGSRMLVSERDTELAVARARIAELERLVDVAEESRTDLIGQLDRANARAAELEEQSGLQAAYEAWLHGQHGIDESYYSDFLEWRKEATGA